MLITREEGFALNRTAAAIAGVILVLLAAAAALLAWRSRGMPAAPVQPPVAAASAVPEQVLPTPAAPAPSAAASGPLHPAPLPVAEGPVPAPDIEGGLVELFGRKAVLSLFQLDDFPRRFVATVDNLGRSHAPSRLWPMNPAPGRFLVDDAAPGARINPDNGLRYTPYVLLLETVDLRQAVDLYARHYPQFQQAYVELGYPKGHFNDRLVEVIDQLLATPQPAQPPAVRLPVIHGPIQPERPWVLYEFEDPAYRSLTAGQKLLLRTGPVNEARIKGRLAELRQLIVSASRTR